MTISGDEHAVTADEPDPIKARVHPWDATLARARVALTVDRDGGPMRRCETAVRTVLGLPAEASPMVTYREALADPRTARDLADAYQAAYDADSGGR